VRPLFWFIVIFIVFGIASHVVLYLLYKGFVNAERKRMDPPQTQVARPKDADVPQNQPLLQPFPRADVPPQRQTPVTDLADMRRAEEAVLRNYGWVDRQHGVVHIPIEEAKRRLAATMAVQGQTGTTTGAVPAGATPALDTATPATTPAATPVTTPAVTPATTPPAPPAGGQP
jgi:hypothetical protein